VGHVLLFLDNSQASEQIKISLKEKNHIIKSASNSNKLFEFLKSGLINVAVVDIEKYLNAGSYNLDTLWKIQQKDSILLIPLISGKNLHLLNDNNIVPDDILIKPLDVAEAVFRVSNLHTRIQKFKSHESDLEKLNILFRIKSLPYEISSMKAILKELLNTIIAAFRAESAVINMREDDEKIHPVCMVGPVLADDLDKILHFVTRMAIAQRNILLYNNLPGELFWKDIDWKRPDTLKNLISIPLEANGKIIGTFELFNIPKYLFSDEGTGELEFLSQIIREVEKTERELKFAVDELSILYEISDALTSTLNLGEMLMLIVRNALKSFSAQVVSIMMLDREKKELSISFAEGLNEEIIKETRVKMGEGVAGRVAQSGEPLLLVDMMGIDTIDMQKDIKSALSVPLKMRGEVIGVLNVSKTSRYRFTEIDLKLLYNMGSLAAQAIEKASLYEDIKNSLEELKSSYMSTVKALSKAIEAKDPYTQGHVDRVAKYGLAIAMQFKPEIIKDDFFRYALILHDIGKIEIPDAILAKKGALNDEEMAIMRRHPEAGAQILKPVKFLRQVGNMVRYHQERYDGKGYPKGLSREEIPMIARIISVADAFDAITSDRPYRKAKSVEEAWVEIKKHAGTQFDPKVVESLKKALDKKIIP